MPSLLKDVRYALRLLRKSRGFTLTAVLTLAVSIGATTAVFSFVDSVLLKPLPYRQSGRLVAIWERVKYLEGRPYVEVNARHEQYWKERAPSFSDITLLRQGTAGLSLGEGHPRIVGVVLGYTNLFSVLGVQPQLGRVFLPQEGTSGHDQVAIITNDLWQGSFGGDPQILGKSLRLSGTPLQIVGVLPANFHFPKGNVLRSDHSGASAWPPPEVFVPLIVNLNQRSFDGDYNFIALGRLKEGVSLQQATSELDTIDTTIIHDYVAAAAAAHTQAEPILFRSYIQPLREAIVGTKSTALWLLLACVCTVLLIACVNLANLQLSRAAAREQDLAVLSALGASPFRLASAALYESLILAAAGGIAGILLARWAVDFFVSRAPVDLPRLDEVRINFPVLVFAMAVSIVTGIAFGILPALKALRVDPHAALQQNSQRTMGARHAGRTRSWLIGTEVFAATALLILMGLLDKSLVRVLSEQRGFETGHVVSVEVDVDGHRYNKDESRAAFDDEILRRLRTLPGVESAGLVSAMPLSGETWVDGISRTDRPEDDSELANYRWISAGYLSTMRTALLRGRYLDDSDRDRRSALISEATAKAVWPWQDPIGRQFRHSAKTYTVVGVVADTRSNSLKMQPGLMVYLPYSDNPPYPTFFSMARTARNTGSLGDAMRRQIWSFDPEAMIAQVRSLDSQVDASLAPERFQAFVLSSLGIAALFLAVLGIYGVLSYSVSIRVRELGIRIALGAPRSGLYRLTMKQAAPPVIAGLTGGVVVSIFAGYLIRSLLYGISPIDIPVTTLVFLIFAAAAALAAFLPARRAASIDPMHSLRME